MGLKKKLISIGSIFMVVLYPCLFMYFQNVAEGNFKEIFTAVRLFLALAALIYGISYLLMRDVTKAALYCNLAMLVAMNFRTILAYIQCVIPQLKAIVLCIFVVIVFSVLLIIFIKAKLQEAENFCKILGIVFGILIIFNFVMAVPSIAEKCNKTVIVYDTDITKAKFENKPNVYFLIYDEYAGFYGLEHYYDYDNQKFADALAMAEVNFSRMSRNKESIFTSTIVPNLLNLDYVATDEGYTVDNVALTENAQMYQMFKHNGYQINMINHLGFLYSAGCNVLNTDIKGDDLSTFILEKSIFEDINKLILRLQNKLTAADTDYLSRNYATIRTLEECAEYISHLKPTFTIGYIQMPHTPFFFREDGTHVPEEMWNDWANKDLYLGNLKYTSDHIIRVIENIKEKDPEALLIIQSDHGVRYPHMLEEAQGYPEYDPEVEEAYMQNILNLVYYKGKVYDIEGLSGVNTLRFMFNEVLGTEFEMIEPKSEPIY